MSPRDLLSLTTGAVLSHRLRSALTMLGILIGIASVILLTSIGEGTRRYILAEFTQFGTNLLAINPGKVQTTGLPGVLGATVRKLTVDDAEAIRRVPGVEKVVPLAMGMARVESEDRGRDVFVYGVTTDVPEVWKFRVRQGRFLPPGDPRRAAPLAVLGPKLKQEIFGDANALGEHVRVGGRRFLVVGVMEPKGRMLGFDIDDSVYVPVAAAQDLFNRDELMEIDVLFSGRVPLPVLLDRIRKVLMARHGGEEDFTMTTQTEMLGVLDRVLRMVSVAVGGIGAISLLVGALGILTLMWISVNERTSEIGLSKAIGASSGQILLVYMAEAVMLSLAGGALGVAVGMGIAGILRLLVPELPVHTPVEFILIALAVSFSVGLASGVLPARRAARMDPIEALRAE